MLHSKSSRLKKRFSFWNQSHKTDHNFVLNRASLIRSLLSLMIIGSLGLCSASSLLNNSTLGSTNQSNNLSLELSLFNGEKLNYSAPEALIVLPEQILPQTVVISMAAIYNNTSAVFLINNTTIKGNNITIEAFSVETRDNHTDYTIQPAQVTLNNLSIGKYTLEIRDRLTGNRITNSSFNVRPFGQLFKEDGLVGHLVSYKGGMVNNTMYLVPSPLNPICPPGLFNYTQIWANATDQFFMGINISNKKGNLSNINLSISNTNLDLKVAPSNGSVKILNNSSSRLILFDVETKGLNPGVYNLTYNLSYTDGQLNNSLTGELHIGVYWVNTSFGINDSINTDFVTPFNDHINQSEQEWKKYAIKDNISIWRPNRVLQNGSYSNFTLQPPRSPWVNTIVGFVGGSVLGASSELAHQCLFQQHLSFGELTTGLSLENLSKGKIGKCDVKWGDLALRTVEGGAAGATIATLGPAVLTAEVAKAVVGGAAISGGFELAGQYFEKGGNTGDIDYGDVAIACGQGGMSGIGWYGAAKAAASYVAVQRGVREGLYSAGSSWEEIGDLGRSGLIVDKIKAAFEYMPRALVSTRALDVIASWESPLSQGGQILTDFLDSKLGEYIIQNMFMDESGTHIVDVSGKYQGFDSPKVDETYIKELIFNSTGKSTGNIDTSIILVFDASGSMGDNHKIDNARIAAKNALATLRPGYEAALIVFYDCGAIVVEQPFTTDWSSFASMIDNIVPHSKTPLYASIAFAKEYMKQNARGKNQRIAVFTDGLETCEGSP